MDLFDIITILITLLAVFSYFNFRYLRMQSSIGLMLCGMVLSLALIAPGWLGSRADSMTQNIILHVDFHRLLSSSGPRSGRTPSPFGEAARTDKKKQGPDHEQAPPRGTGPPSGRAAWNPIG